MKIANRIMVLMLVTLPLLAIRAHAATDITTQVKTAKAGVLLLPKGGDFNIEGPISGLDHVVIDGNGGQLHVASIGSSVFKPTGTGFTLRNFSLIDQQDKTKPTCVVIYDTGTNTTLSGNVIVGLLKAFDAEYGADAPQILNNKITGYGSVGVYITVNHCLVHGNAFDSSMGEYNLRFEPPTNKQGQSIYNADKTLLKVTSGEVTNNSFVNHNPYYKDCVGIRMGDNIFFSGNTINGSIRLGQMPAAAGECNVGLVITGNTFVYPNADAKRYVGTLLIYDGVSGQIDGNTFLWNEQSPIQVSQTSSVTVTGNIQQAAPGAKVSRLVAISSSGQYGPAATPKAIDVSNRVVPAATAAQPSK